MRSKLMPTTYSLPYLIAWLAVALSASAWGDEALDPNDPIDNLAIEIGHGVQQCGY